RRIVRRIAQRDRAEARTRRALVKRQIAPGDIRSVLCESDSVVRGLGARAIGADEVQPLFANLRLIGRRVQIVGSGDEPNWTERCRKYKRSHREPSTPHPSPPEQESCAGSTQLYRTPGSAGVGRFAHERTTDLRIDSVYPLRYFLSVDGSMVSARRCTF